MLQRTITSSAHPVPAALIAMGCAANVAVDGYCWLSFQREEGFKVTQAIAQSSHDTKLGARFALLDHEGYPMPGLENLSAADAAKVAYDIMDATWKIHAYA